MIFGVGVVAALLACLPSNSSASTNSPSSIQKFFDRKLGVSLVLPSADFKVTRGVNSVRLQIYSQADVEKGLGGHQFYVEMIQRAGVKDLPMLKKACLGVPVPLPNVVDGYWCKFSPEGSDDTGDGGPSHLAFMPTSAGILSITVGGTLKDGAVERILKSIQKKKE